MNPNPKWWQDFAAKVPADKSAVVTANRRALFQEVAADYREFVEKRMGGYEWAAMSDCPSGEHEKLSFSEKELNAVFYWAEEWFQGKEGSIGDRQLARRYWGLLYGWHDGRWKPGILGVIRFRAVTPMEQQNGRTTPEGGHDELDSYLMITDFRNVSMGEVLERLYKANICSPSDEEFLRKRTERLFEKG